jgi:hypothetical protein
MKITAEVPSALWIELLAHAHAMATSRVKSLRPGSEQHAASNLIVNLSRTLAGATDITVTFPPTGTDHDERQAA